jgi:hypothetical protein
MEKEVKNELGLRMEDGRPGMEDGRPGTEDRGPSFKSSRFSISGLRSPVPGLYLILIFAFCFFSFTSLTGCEESLQPFQKNEQFHFTIFGYLDASADTQWVRISPARQEFDMPAEKPEMEVSLENLSNGETVAMNDTLLHLGQGFNALNVWSVMNIEPNGSYRLRANLPDGAESRVTITVPEEFPTPRLFTLDLPEVDTEYHLWIEDVERLADVQSRWYIRIQTASFEEKRMVTKSLKQDAVMNSLGNYSVQLFPDREMEFIRNQIFTTSNPETEITFLYHQLYIAAGGPEWNEEIASMDDLLYSLPDSFSNVEDGLGYMVGIVSTLIPFESCYDENGALIACDEEEPFW